MSGRHTRESDIVVPHGRCRVGAVRGMGNGEQTFVATCKIERMKATPGATTR